MKLLKIEDNSCRKKECFSDIQNLTDKVAGRALKQLADEGVFVFPEIVTDADDISQNQKIIWSDENYYKSGNVMGFLGYKDERLIIKSRFSGEGDDDFFCWYLISRIFDIPNIIDLISDVNHDDWLFNFWLFLFPYYLKTAMRKGLFRKYICCKYNDENVNGIIDIARHIKKNTPFIGHIAYSQREFSCDNSLMELVRHTIEFIKQKPYGNKLLRTVKDEVRGVIEATQKYKLQDRQKIIEQNKKSHVRHAYFHEYLALQKLCLLILRHQKHQIGYGKKQIYGILFDGSWLWEEYINLLIKDKFYHPTNKGERKGAQRLFNVEDRNIGLIYPDFIGKDDKNRIITDAKYKPKENIGLGNADYFQVLAYMFRFDAKKGYFLYPESENKSSEDVKLFLNKGSTYKKDVTPRDDVCVIKHGLKIPVGMSRYNDFVLKIKDYERDFISLFNSAQEIV